MKHQAQTSNSPMKFCENLFYYNASNVAHLSRGFIYRVICILSLIQVIQLFIDTIDGYVLPLCSRVILEWISIAYNHFDILVRAKEYLWIGIYNMITIDGKLPIPYALRGRMSRCKIFISLNL